MTTNPCALPNSMTTASATSAKLDVTQLFREHAGRVERTLRRLGVRESDVADATQEVFMVAHRKLHAFEGRASVTTWLYRIALRVAAGQRRLARHRRELASDELIHAAEAEQDLPVELERRALLRQLSRAFDRLSEPQRAVLVLHELEGLTMHEAARRLSIPRKTAFSRMYAARRALANELRRLGCAVPVWLPLCAPTTWLRNLRAAVEHTPTGQAKLGRSRLVSWGQAKAPVYLALCAALATPVASPVPSSPATLATLEAPLKAPELPQPVFEAAPAAPEPPAPTRPRHAHTRRATRPRPAQTTRNVTLGDQPSPTPGPSFQVIRMSSADVRPVLPHPFAKRVGTGGASVPPLTARLAPKTLDPTLPLLY